LVFTSPNTTRSLVLSSINYFGVDSPGTPNYKLKIVGAPSSPLLRFGIEDPVNKENLQIYQPFIAVQENSPTNWSWIFDNSTANGNIFFGVNGNSLQIDAATPQSVFNSSVNALQTAIAVSTFDFGAQVKLQSSPSERLLSFAVSNSGSEFFHIGRHTGLATTTDRLLSISDTGQISVGDAFSNPSGSTTYHTDFLESDLAQTPLPAPNDWLRLRGRTATTGTTYDMLTVTHNRLFDDMTGGPSNQSSMIRIQHDSNNVLSHFIGFTGGVDDASGTLWPQMRFGYVNDYYMSGDQNGRIGIGTNAFIKRFNNVNVGSTFGSKLNIEGNPGTGGGGDTVTGGSSFSGIHLFSQNFVNAQVGITAGGIGLGQDPLTTFAGVHFKDESSATDQGLELHFGTSVYDDTLNLSFHGEKTRITVQRYGDTDFWSKSSTTHSLFIEPGGRRDNTLGKVYPNNNVHIGSKDSGVWKDILLNAGTETTGFGGGFVGIGQYNGFSENISAGPTLVVGQWYMSKVGTAVHNAITYPADIPFQAANTTLTSGTVVLSNPVTKFQVNEAVTFGTRKPITTYSADAALNSFTIGKNHSIPLTGIRGVIIGGSGHTVSGTDGIIIGYSGGTGVNMIDANKVLLATTTHVSVLAPTTPLALNLYSTDYDVPGNYRLTSSPMLKVSTIVTPPPFFVIGERGDLGRVAVLEARTTGLGLTEVPVGLEFHVRNPNTSREIGMVYGNYNESVTGGTLLQTGKISFATLSHFYPVGSPTPTSGSIYEIANISANGLQFVPTSISGSNVKPAISVEAAKIVDGAGDPLFISAGAGNDAAHGATGPTVGGNLFLGPGQGKGGGIDGTVAVGNNSGNGGIVTLNGNVQGVSPTFANPGPIFSVFNGVGVPFSTVQSTVGDTLTVTVSAAGTSTLTSGTIWSGDILAVSYDRTIVITTGGSASGEVLGELRLPPAAPLSYRRMHHNVFGGDEFLIPANTTINLRYDAHGAGFSLSVNSHTWTIRAFKHGL
jgi:hypothetical protein